MATLILFAPLFLVFEVVQLVLSERYLGIKQISRGADPRTLGLSEVTAFFWTMTIIAYWIWMIALLFITLGRINGLGLMAVCALGFSFRRGNPMKWTLVILTFEGALRVGFLISLIAMVWHKL